MILADTSAWIDFLRDRETSAASDLDRALGTNRVLIGDLILVELLQGYSDGRQLEDLKRDLQLIPVMTLCGPSIAFLAADNYRLLRRKGITVRGTIDVIIATWCVENDVPLIHDDRDYNGMEKWLGLKRWEG